MKEEEIVICSRCGAVLSWVAGRAGRPVRYVDGCKHCK